MQFCKNTACWKHQTFLLNSTKMHQMVKIRRAEAADASVIADFQIEMALETERLQLDRYVVQAGVSGVFEDSSRGKYYVAEMDGRIVGSLLTTFEWSDWRNGTVLWIQSVFVIPSFRRRGVYSRMYQYLQDMVKSDTSLRGIRLYADRSNTAAHQAYRNLGMNDEHYRTFEWMKE